MERMELIPSWCCIKRDKRGKAYKQKLAGGTIGASAAPMTPHQEISSPGPQRANRLGNNNKQSAPVIWKSQRELPGIRKPAAVRKNEFTHFLRPDAGFRCAPCSTARQRSWLPGSSGPRYPSNCGKLLVIEVAQHPPLAGPGWHCHPGGVWGKAPTYPFPRQISVFQSLQAIKTPAGKPGGHLYEGSCISFPGHPHRAPAQSWDPLQGRDDRAFQRIWAQPGGTARRRARPPRTWRCPWSFRGIRAFRA